MERNTDWSREEFAILLVSPHLTSAELESEIQRSSGAIDVVRQGVHLHHETGDDKGMLSQMMRAFLDRRSGQYVCAVCTKSQEQ